MSGRVGTVGGGATPTVSEDRSSCIGPASTTGCQGGCPPSYPRQSYLVLGAFPSAVPCARLHARLVLAEWGLSALAETAELLVSELVTNAVRASEGLGRYNLPTVQMWLSADHERVLIQVWDGNEQMPVRQEPELDAEHGRGLSIVAALSESCGAYRLERENGKIAWARCVGPAGPV